MTAPRDSPLEQDEVLILFDIHDFDVLNGHLPIPMVARHLQTFKGVVRKCRRTDRTSVTEIFVRAMGPG
jgi:hypothetical protein